MKFSYNFKDHIMQSNKKLLFLISLGAVLEYYDFAIYIYLAPLIGKALIPATNPTLNLALSYTIFAIGALFRPMGGIIFSHFGDKYGRSKTFMYTILCMAIPTFLIAMIPDYNNIGIMAMILLLIFRILQGFAIGGEVPGSIVFGYEISSKNKKALNSAIVVLGINIGFVLASIVCELILKIQNINSWRIAFVVGGILGIFSYFLRKKISETPEFLNYRQNLELRVTPIKILFKEQKGAIFQILGLTMFLASSLAVFTFYMPSYLHTFYHFPLAKLMEFNSFSIVIFCVGSLIAGFFDQYFNRKFFLIFIPLFVIAAIFIFLSYSYLNLEQIFILHIILLLFIGIVCGRIPVLCATFFPVKVRYSGVAIVYNISFGVVAGLTQALLTWLIGITGILWLPGIYILVFAVIAFIAVIVTPHPKFVDYT